MTTKNQNIDQFFASLLTYPTADLVSEIEENDCQLLSNYSEIKQLIDRFQNFVNSTSITDLE
jgi:hypothetical protein